MELYRVMVHGKTIKVIMSDITDEDTDAIVNPANNYLQHTGGIAGAIVRRGGDSIQLESNKIGYVKTGDAVITSAGKLKTRYIIHTVGPIWKGGTAKEPELLEKAVKSALEIAKNYSLFSIALPAISTGIFGYPKEQGIKVIIKTTTDFLKSFDFPKEVHFTNIDDLTSNLFADYLKSINGN